MIQNKINSGGGNGKVIISKLSIGEMNATNIPFSTNLVVTPLSSLPVRVGLNDLKFNLAHKSLQNGDFNDVATLDMPKDFDFWLNNDIKLDFEGQVSVSAEQASRGQVMLNNMFGESFGTRDELRLNFAPKISVYGMTLYRSLPLYRKLDVMGTVGNLEKIIASMKTKSTSEPSKIVFENPNYTGKELEKNYGSDQIMELPESFGKQKLVWKDLKMPMDDYSLGLSLAAAFENPTVFHVAKISSVEFYLKSQGEYLAKISLGKILLRPGLNEDFEIGVKVTFDDPQIDLVRTQDAIEKIATQFANTGDFEFAFAGPIKFGDAGFVQVYTKDIKISGKFSDLKRLSEKDTSESVPAGEDPTSTLKGYLGNSDISLAVVADKIMANLGLNLPSLSFVKPPAGLEFPYHAKMALYGESMKLLEFNSNPIVATRVQDGLLIKLGAEVKAENSPAAADEMAKILNPVLSLDPKVLLA